MMKKIKIPITLLFLLVFTVSCFQEIDKVPLEKTTEQVFISPYSIYKNVTFFKIYENTTQEVDNQTLGSWDLAFQSVGDDDIVLVNYTISATAIKSGISDFDAVDEQTLNELLQTDEWKFNDPAYSNYKDSTALKDWESKEVYVVNRGSAYLPQQKYYKLQFVSKTDDSYTFRYSHIGSGESFEKTVKKSQGLTHIYFSFNENATVSYEPLIGEWDFYFAPYFGWYETLEEGVYAPYNLTGVMINNESGLRVAQVFDESIAFEDISLSMAEGLEYTDWKGVIGSTWKKIPSIDNPVYTMDTAKKYVIRHSDGNYYKLRFLDFYNDLGEKGFTSFEILVLN